MAAYGKPNGFIRASGIASGTCENTDPGTSSGIDRGHRRPVPGRDRRGIITAWVIGLLNNAPEAADPAVFRDYFDNMVDPDCTGLARRDRRARS